MGKKSKRPGRANRPAKDKRNQDNQHNASSSSTSTQHAEISQAGGSISEVRARANAGDLIAQMRMAEVYKSTTREHSNGVLKQQNKVTQMHNAGWD